jgi:4-aminobutyrate aminotransferase-like enzyme
MPPEDFADMLREIVMPIAPTGTNQVHLTDGTITSANETAVSVALMSYAMKHKRDYKSLTVLGFENGSHGQSVAMLSCSDNRVNQAGVATYDWPTAALPQLKYPLAANDKSNQAEEDRCVASFEAQISQQRDAGNDVGAVIIEPITSFENKSGTPVFYKRIRAICAREGIPFIVDETRTGFGQSGKMWAHDYWYLNETNGGSPDIVTFGGKTGVSGFYSTTEFRLHPQCASFD